MSNNLRPLPTVGEHVTRLIPYSPGKPIDEVKRELGLTEITKLASNENSLGPSPLAIAALTAAANTAYLYPDAASYDLREAAAIILGVPADHLIFGNGSDEIIHLIGLAFLRANDALIQADPSFVRYEASATLAEGLCIKVPLINASHDLPAMAKQITAQTKLIYITNPNNPTGTIVNKNQVDNFMSKVPDSVLVVFDEAYYEYVDDPDYPQTVQYVKEGRNVIVLRTFSKAYGLAGFRLGYGISRPEIIGYLNQVREPFNINLLAQAAGVAALGDLDHLRNTREMNHAGKEYLYEQFRQLGLSYTPTEANFIWVDVHQDSRALFNLLLHEGVIVRTGDVFGSPTHLRITIGTEEQNRQFITALRKNLKK